MVWNKLYRAEFLKDEALYFNEEMQYGEDELFNLECLSCSNRIFCTGLVAVVHHFDNKASLSRSKTGADLIEQAHHLEDFMHRSEDPRVRCAVCRILSEHWGSESYLVHVGGMVKD